MSGSRCQVRATVGFAFGFQQSGSSVIGFIVGFVEYRVRLLVAKPDSEPDSEPDYRRTRLLEPAYREPDSVVNPVGSEPDTR